MSQFGIEEILWEIFGEGFKGVAVDVGASDGVKRSNTYELEREGWTVVCVEPNFIYQKSLQRHRKIVKPYAVSDFEGQADFTAFDTGGGNFEAVSALHPDPLVLQKHAKLAVAEIKTKVEVKLLDTILHEVGLTRLDYLNIDVEGGEEGVMRGFSLRKWLPKVVSVEQWEHKNSSLRPLFEATGYELKVRLHNNDDVYVLA